MRLIWKKEWTLLVALFLTLRLIYSALGMVIASGPDPEPLAVGPIYVAAGSLLHQDQFSHLFINVWERRDTGWYLKVAVFSYGPTDGSIAFQPLYPGLGRDLVALTGGYPLSALLISNLACLRRLDPALSLYALLTLALFFVRSRILRLGLWVELFGPQIFLLLGFLDWRWTA